MRAPDDSGRIHGMTYDGADFYCDVALRDVDALRVEHDGDEVLAFHHTRPHREVHIVVVPKRHVSSLAALAPADEPLARELFLVVQRIAAQVETAHRGASVVTNLGKYQDSKHLHVHVLSGSVIKT